MTQIKQAGMTLLEAMISLLIGVFLLGGVSAAYIAMRTTTDETVGMSELQQNGRMALAFLTADIQQAGFRGMLTAFNNTVAAPAAFANDCTNAIAGGSFPVAGAGFATLWGQRVVAPNVLGCINDANINSDVIQIKRATSPALVAGFRADSFYLQANASQGLIFAGPVAPAPINQQELWRYQHHVYYVTNQVFNGNTVPVLARFQLVNTPGGPQMVQTAMLDGIERMHFHYGVDSDGDGVINSYIPANAMPNLFWQAGTTIKAVKIFLLTRAMRPDPNYTNNNSYDLGDNAPFLPNDNFRRMQFSTTVYINQAIRG